MDAREGADAGAEQLHRRRHLVSHDPHLVENVADRLWLVAGGTCVPYDDDLDAYRKLVVQQRKREREGSKQEARARKHGKKSAAVTLEEQAARLEESLRLLAAEKDAIENELAVCSTSGDAKQLSA